MVVVGAHNIITSLGWTSEKNFTKVINGEIGITPQVNSQLSDVDFPASLISEHELKLKADEQGGLESFSKLEQLSILSLKQTITKVNAASSRTGFVFSTTKGNIDYLKNSTVSPNTYLGHSAQVVADYFGFKNTPHIVSNACISGLAAFIVAKRLIDMGVYDDVVIVGVDVLSKFVVSGFQSFQSLSDKPCMPFDKNRDGLSLGDGVASIVLTNKVPQCKLKIEVVNGAITNDANHISGPSRTGEGLYRAIKQTLKNGESVDMISAHGTATPYNDDMESQAINRAGFSAVPVCGLKGYIGHTLGAAGVIESIISIMALEKNLIFATKGLQKQGVVAPLNVVTQNIKTSLTGVLKLMSGFGGCNAAVYFKKHE